MNISISTLGFPKVNVLIAACAAGGKFAGTVAQWDKKAGGQLSKAAKAADFSGDGGQFLEVLAPDGFSADRIWIFGIGDVAKIGEKEVRSLGGRIMSRLSVHGIKTAAVAADLPAKVKVAAEDYAAGIAEGARLKSYRFDLYRSKASLSKKPTLSKLTIMTKDVAKTRSRWKERNAVVDGVFFARDLVSEPANVLYPKEFAARAKTLTELGVKVEILGEKQMEKLGMGSLLGVGRGSQHESQLVVMQWMGATNKKAQPIAFVGKGVTFDTGGISLKPSAGMGEMKYDMGGAGTVTGLMRALAGRKAKANVIGIIGLVENMPDGTAQRPGDVVTSMSGQTIEVLNTDAEGRLVLADALWYCQNRFKPTFMVDLATLTGAIIMALGTHKAGLFASDDALADQIFEAGNNVDETVWRFPLEDTYDRTINSQIADMQNISDGRGAGSITAAQFLQRFTNKVPWAHLDIAGTAWTKADKPVCPKGATGFGVRLLDRMVADHYEGRRK